MEYEKGFTGTLLASTGESPGTNRLEVSCDMGRLVYEGGDSFILMKCHCRACVQPFGSGKPRHRLRSSRLQSARDSS